jgi:hypothetical protein
MTECRGKVLSKSVFINLPVQGGKADIDIAGRHVSFC